MRRQSIVLSLLFILVLAFQNCGFSGGISADSSELAGSEDITDEIPLADRMVLDEIQMGTGQGGMYDGKPFVVPNRGECHAELTFKAIHLQKGGGFVEVFQDCEAVEPREIPASDIELISATAYRYREETYIELEEYETSGAPGQVSLAFAELDAESSSEIFTIASDNLTATSSVSGQGSAIANKGVSTGKWYWEVTWSAGGKSWIGIMKDDWSAHSEVVGTGVYYYSQDGRKRNHGQWSNYGEGYQIGDVIGVALDLDLGTLTYYKNGVSQGVAASDLSGTYFPAVHDYGSSEFNESIFNFGASALSFQVPEDFLLLRQE